MSFQLKNFSPFPSWHGVVVVLLISLALGYYTHEFILIDKLSTVVDLFSFLPFTAFAYIGGIYYISSSITSLKGLSVSERNRITGRLSSKRRLYTTIGTLNIAFGLCIILLYIFTDLTNILRFVVTSAVYLAILTMALCAFEQLYLNSFKQSIHERETKREEKQKLLNEYNETNNPAHA